LKEKLKFSQKTVNKNDLKEFLDFGLAKTLSKLFGQLYNLILQKREKRRR
jgi:hypothetical protein